MRAAKLLTARGAIYRQRQFIGKLMRKFDPEPLRAALAQRAIASGLVSARDLVSG